MLGADKGSGRQISDPAAGLRRQGARRLHRAAIRTRSAATCCSARTSKATARPMSPRSIAYGKRIKVYPLAQAANPPPTVFTDAKDVAFDSTIRYDASFFEHLDRIVQSEPWLAARPRDDRSAEVARHREGQAVQARTTQPRRCSTAASREAQALARSQIRRRPAAVLFRDAAAGPFRRRPSSSRQRRSASPIRTHIRSTLAGWPIAMPLSASSGWAPASSI